MRNLGKLLISVGLGVLLFASWTLWGTDLYQGRAQARLGRELDGATTVGSWASLAVDGRPGPPRGFSPRPGDPVFRLRIPAIGLSQVVVEGVGPAQLRTGPGHYPACRPGFAPPLCAAFGEVWPGELGRMVISGHRTTYGAPFDELDRLRPGDRILVDAPWRAKPFVYVVTGSDVVAPSSRSVVVARPEPELVLTTCHPRFSSARRLVVFAVLEGSG